MAKRSSPPTPKLSDARLSHEEIEAGIARLSRRLEEVKALNPLAVQRPFPPEVDALEAAVDEALSRTFGKDTHDYQRYRAAARIDRTSLNVGHAPELWEVQKGIADGRLASIALLERAISGLREEAAERKNGALPTEDTSKAIGKRVFIVHGHDEGARESVARFLEKLGLEPVILHEQPNAGRTLITKFREVATEVSFAVVIMTPDDVGGKRGSEQRARARQNVVFELGFFIGALGSGRVAALMKEGVEKPSDLDGIAYTEMDRGGWKFELARELKNAGLPIDMNDAI